MTSFGHTLEGSRDGGRFINYKLAPEDILLTCPYESSHRVEKSRFGRHLAKCRENYKKAKKAQKKPVDVRICRWNAFHHYPAPEIQYHEENCSDQADIVGHLAMLNDPDIKNLPVANNPSNEDDWGENWEDEANMNRAQNPRGYNPQQKLKNSKGLIATLPGITTKSEREAFRLDQYNKFINSGGNFQDPALDEDAEGEKSHNGVGFSIPSTSASEQQQLDEDGSVSNSTSSYYSAPSSPKYKRGLSSEGFKHPGHRRNN